MNTNDITITADQRVDELRKILGFENPVTQLTIDFHPGACVIVNGCMYMKSNGMDAFIRVFKEFELVPIDKDKVDDR